MTQPGAPGAPGSAGQPAFLDMPLREFLGALASGTPAPGGGASAALAVTLSAGLCAMAARLSARQLDGDTASELTNQAERILAASASLLQADAESYGRVISAMRSPAGADPAGRERAVAAALSGAADVPLDIIALGAETAALAARLAGEGNPALRGDAVTAAVLADAGARAAAVLVGINLAGLPADERHARAGSLLAEAAHSAGAASRPPQPPEQPAALFDGPGDDVSDPRELLLGYLDWYREALLRKIDGLSDAQLRTPAGPMGWSPLGMVKHLGWVERRWIQWGFGAEDVVAWMPDADRAEYNVTAGEPAAEVLAAYHREVERTRELCAPAALADASKLGGRFPAPGPAPSLGRILFHLLQEYARHVGQLDIARELIDGTTGE